MRAINQIRHEICSHKGISVGGVVVAQLVERLLPMSEVCGLNPVIGKIYIEHFVYLFTINCIEKTKIS